MSAPDPWADDRYQIETPERIDLQYDVAGIGSRFLAAVIDTIILMILALLVLFLGFLGLAFAFGVTTAAFGARPEQWRSTLAVAVVVLLEFAILWGYFVFFELVWHGQTPGKRWIGLRVIKDGGYPIGFVDSAIRNIVRIVDFLPFYYSLGAIVMFLDPRSRRLGDLAAGTLVVKERKDLRPDTLLLIHPSATAGGPADAGDGQAEPPIPNLSRLTSADHSLLREYLARRRSLDRSASATLAARLANVFAKKLNHDLAGELPQLFLERLARQAGMEVAEGAGRKPRRRNQQGL